MDRISTADPHDHPERYWVMRPFLHYSAVYPESPQPDQIDCAQCGRKLFSAKSTDDDSNPLLMFHDKPICPTCAVEKINEHPLTPRYMTWLDEGDPRWWSPWFCDCGGCEPLSVPRSDA